MKSFFAKRSREHLLNEQINAVKPAGRIPNGHYNFGVDEHFEELKCVKPAMIRERSRRHRLCDRLCGSLGDRSRSNSLESDHDDITPALGSYGRGRRYLSSFHETGAHHNELHPKSEKSYQKGRPCRLTCVFDSQGKFYYIWDVTVSVAFLYNLWALIYRYAFDEISTASVRFWFSFDYFADFIYILDIFLGFRTAFLEDGVLQTNKLRLRIHYVNSTRFYLDCLSLLPLDLLYLSLGYCSLLRGFRLSKVYRFFEVLDKTERHSSYPNVFRLLTVLQCALVIFHWNACLLFIFRDNFKFAVPDSLTEAISRDSSQPLPSDPPDTNKHLYNSSVILPKRSQNDIWSDDDHVYNYLLAFYFSGKALTLLSIPEPVGNKKLGLIFSIVELIGGFLLFATILGYIAAIVTNVGVSRKEFQVELDGVKSYMKSNSVPENLQHKVIRWFDYLWSTKKGSRKANAIDILPNKLKAEIALQVHLDTLKRVEIFQNTEPGFLRELVLRLHPMLCSPGDYVCRRGEVGKEMYIVSSGKLRVLANDGVTVLATLKAGSYFGEIAVLNMGQDGSQESNRRTASVVSVGYTDLFCLTKREIWEVLEEYPAARTRLEQIATKRLQMKREMAIRKELSRPHEDITSLVSAPGCLEGSRLKSDIHKRGKMRRRRKHQNASGSHVHHHQPISLSTLPIQLPSDSRRITASQFGSAQGTIATPATLSTSSLNDSFYRTDSGAGGEASKTTMSDNSISTQAAKSPTATSVTGNFPPSPRPTSYASSESRHHLTPHAAIITEGPKPLPKFATGAPGRISIASTSSAFKQFNPQFELGPQHRKQNQRSYAHHNAPSGRRKCANKDEREALLGGQSSSSWTDADHTPAMGAHPQPNYNNNQDIIQKVTSQESYI